MSELPPPLERLPDVLIGEIAKLQKLLDENGENARQMPAGNWKPIADKIAAAIDELEKALNSMGAAS